MKGGGKWSWRPHRNNPSGIKVTLEERKLTRWQLTGVPNMFRNNWNNEKAAASLCHQNDMNVSELKVTQGERANRVTISFWSMSDLRKGDTLKLHGLKLKVHKGTERAEKRWETDNVET